MSKNIEVPVIRADLVEDSLRVIPLVEHRFNSILVPFKPKSDRAFIGPSPGVAFDSQLHHLIMIPRGSRDPFLRIFTEECRSFCKNWLCPAQS